MAADGVLVREGTPRPPMTCGLTLPQGVSIAVGDAVVLVVTRRQGGDPSLRFSGRCLSVDSETREAVFAIDTVPEFLYSWLISGTVVDVAIGSS